MREEGERILTLDCNDAVCHRFGLTMYTVHVSIAHWIHYNTGCKPLIQK